ncbi:MAG: energy transducer TonB, partial [Pseudomonadota bacterium]
MQIGYLISGAAHALFLVVLVFGGLFARDRLPPVVVADVTVLSAEEFAALVPEEAVPTVETDVPEPAAPEIASEAEPNLTEEAAPQIAALPEPTEPPAPDTA